MGLERERYPLTGRFLAGRLRHAMSEEEKAIVESLVEEVRDVPADETVLGRAQVSDHSTILIEGFTLRTIEADDRRFVVGFQVPGDFVDLHSFPLKRLDHNVVTVGPARIGIVPHEWIQDVMNRWPHLSRLLWFSTLLDAAIHREWIMKLEQLPTARRVAHIYAEIWYRLDLVGLARNGVVRTPLNQNDLADMAGSSSVHMSRALTQLRNDGIADYRRGDLFVKDRAALEAFGAFDPTYLYSEGGLRIGDELSPSEWV